MCGIVGYTGSENSLPYLLDGLTRLEYRGYDSAGVALQTKGDFWLKRSVGQVSALRSSIENAPTATTGIAHTRWATHGAPTETNAHPHRAGDLILVHNGIIENYAALKNRLMAEGAAFASQTDTEVFAKLIESHLKKSQNLFEAIQKAMPEVDGHYAILVMSLKEPGVLYAVQNGAPLIVSHLPEKNEKKGGVLLASDLQAIVPYHNEISFLAAGEILKVTPEGFTSFRQGKPSPLKKEIIHWSAEEVEKDGFETFMLKEIFQQPMVVADTLSGRLPLTQDGAFLWDRQPEHEAFWKKAERLVLVACGSSYHTALVAKYFFEKWARLDCQVDIASEYRYRDPILDSNTVVGFISQSGETADTLAALRLANEKGATTFAICNVPGSTIMREAQFNYPIKAGPEIGVASTKAFTAQLTLFCALALDVGRLRHHFDLESFQALARLPHDLNFLLQQSEAIIKVGESLAKKKLTLFIGRGTMAPVALEGALKMKELTYLPSEGFAAGELKHGPIAYIDPEVAIVALIPNDELFSKTLSNIEEVKARGGFVITIATEGDHRVDTIADHIIRIPKSSSGTAPILAAIPLQLIAYGCAKALGRNIDKPRNLAKSVTVE